MQPLPFSTPPRWGQFGAGLLFGEGLLSDGPDTIIYQSLGARGAWGSPLNWLQHGLEKWKRFGQDRKAMNNQSVSREYSYFQAWINVPLDKHTTAGNWLGEPISQRPQEKTCSYMTPATLFIKIDWCVVYVLSPGPCTSHYHSPSQRL